MALHILSISGDASSAKQAKRRLTKRRLNRHTPRIGSDVQNFRTPFGIYYIVSFEEGRRESDRGTVYGTRIIFKTSRGSQSPLTLCRKL